MFSIISSLLIPYSLIVLDVFNPVIKHFKLVSVDSSGSQVELQILTSFNSVIGLNPLPSS